MFPHIVEPAKQSLRATGQACHSRSAGFPALVCPAKKTTSKHDKFCRAITLVCLLGVFALGVHAGAQQQPAQLGLSAQIQYSQVIQGATDPINAYVYNFAPYGGATLYYQVTAAYGANYATAFDYYYTGTLAANGGASPTPPATFDLDTANLSPGTVPVLVTGSNTVSGGTVQLGGQMTVLAHASPAIYINNQIVPLTSGNVITFRSNSFAESTPGGTEASGSANPQMLGDPPTGVPTADLDIDSVSSFGSSAITSTLTPTNDLLSTDTPGTGEFFQINALFPTNQDYDSTTFLVRYSDEQDLPGADAPGSELAEFQVNAELDGTNVDWTVTTDVPEPTTTALVLTGLICCLLVCRRSARATVTR